jgi:hypothetical protein
MKHDVLIKPGSDWLPLARNFARDDGEICSWARRIASMNRQVVAAITLVMATCTAWTDQPASLHLPEIEGPKPWNEKPVLNGNSRFTFGVMTDNTGGHRPGVWLKGIRHLNLLRPEFVVSVGDLIEGYTTNKSEIEEQWRGFLAEMDQMEMRFFFVPGNHDLSNPVMHEIWRQKFGREWYSFDYKGVHFLCLSSEDPHETHISEEQIQFVREDLERHKDARWTFVFMHKPLWVSAERAQAAGNPDPTNWSKVEVLLKSRPHTVFAGHVHHYVQYDRNGTNYYQLATTGGGSQLRGIPYGEFDQVTWVTMEEDGPRVAHVLLGGVLAPDVVTEKGIARFRNFLQQAIVRVTPTLGDSSDALSSGTIQIQVANRFDTPFRLSASIRNLPYQGLTMSPERIEYEAAPGDERTLVVNYSFAKPIPIEQLSSATLTATVQSVEKVPLTAEFNLPITIDRQFPCPKRESGISVDGSLAEWQLEQSLSNRPVMFGDVKAWNGPKDASLQFTVAHDDKNLYFAGHVVDDRIMPGKDRLYVRIDARPMEERITTPEYSKGCFRLEATPPTEDGPIAIDIQGDDGAKVHSITSAAYRKSGDGYDIEIALPIQHLVDAQGAYWRSFQLSAGLADVDGDEGPTFILWRGSPDILEKNTNFAHFRRQ